MVTMGVRMRMIVTGKRGYKGLMRHKSFLSFGFVWYLLLHALRCTLVLFKLCF